jgi:pSer/pThr/pTyr-binding forkhead associated (FHA) protein
MPKLILKRKAEVLSEFTLRSANATYSIGSDPGNDLVINDKLVSMTHLYVERQGNQYFVRDLKSAFGTLVNGEQLTSKVEIHDGDIIQVGDHTLVFKNPLENPKAEAKGKPRQAIEEFWGDIKESVLNSPESGNGESNSGEPVVEEAHPAEKKGGQRPTFKASPRSGIRLGEAPGKVANLHTLEKSPFYFLAIYGPYLGKKYQLNFGETRIGRDVKLNDIVIRQNKEGEVDPSVSRRHATVSQKEGGFFITDKRSQSRTHVNEHCLSETDEVQLVPGDEIEIVSDQQSTIFRFVAEGNWDFAPPRKAGEWYVRFRSRAVDVATVTLLAIGGVFGFQAAGGWMMATQKPKPFKVQHEQFVRNEVNAAKDKSVPIAAEGVTLRPVARDFNGDRYVDVAYALPNGELVAMDGRLRRRLWQASGVIVDATHPLTVADLNGNHLGDVVAITSDGRLSGIDGLYGAEIWTSPIFESRLVGSAAVGDLDRDGLPDVAAITMNDKLEVGYSRVNNLDWVEIDLGVNSQVSPTIGDLTGDGADDVLIAAASGLILIYNGMERRISETIDVNETLNKASGSFTEVHEVHHPVAMADMNGDGRLDIALATTRGEVLCIDGATRRALWWAETNDGAASAEVAANLVLGDIDRDGLPDVVLANDHGLYGFRGTRRDAQKEQPFWENIDGAAGASSTEIAVADFDRDGAVDAVRVQGGKLQMVDGVTGERLWESGDDLAFFPEHTEPLVADFAKNGYLDVLLLDRAGGAHLFSTNRRVRTAMVMWGQRHATAGNASLAPREASKSGKYIAILTVSVIAPVAMLLGNVMARRRRKAFAKT